MLSHAYVCNDVMTSCFERFQLMENVDNDLNGTIASFEHFSVSCHSSGCEPTLHMALNFTDQVKVKHNLTFA